jgi:hypothetical protein
VEHVDAALRDGYAVAHHDALMTAVRAIRISDDNDPDTGFSSGGVKDALFALHGENHVEAASGTLSFHDGRGDPEGKRVPVLEFPQPAPGSEIPDPYVTQ